jgi:excisionase family DNA binding protein
MDTALPCLLTPVEVATWLSMPTARVVKLARKKEIPCIILPGNEVMFDRAELCEWVKSLGEKKVVANAD